MANDYLVHYGILGMHWGVRRYQPYSVVPRGSGEGGKEIGEAAKSAKSIERANKRIAKRNVKSAFKQMNKNIKMEYTIDKKLNKDFNKLEKYNRKGINSGAPVQKLVDRISDKVVAKHMLNVTNNTHKSELIKATEAVGKDYVNKILDKTKGASTLSDVGDSLALTIAGTLIQNMFRPGTVFVADNVKRNLVSTSETYKQAKDVVDNKKISNEVHIDASNKSKSDNQSTKTSPEVEKQIKTYVNNAKTKGRYDMDFLERLSDSQMEKSDAELSKDYEEYLRKKLYS